jgi:uncharacterized delta-60 repeat protein
MSERKVIHGQSFNVANQRTSMLSGALRQVKDRVIEWGRVDIAIARYNPNGSLDSSFDGDGKRTLTFTSGSAEEARGVAVQADGKIVVGGFTNANGPNGFAVARFNANGSLDTSFGSGGKVITAIAAHATINALLIQPAGRIVVAGTAGTTTSSQDLFALARYNSNGSLDSTFGGTGIVTTTVGDTLSRVSSLAQQADGKLVAAGTALFDGFDTDYAVVRYNTDGTLDSTPNGGAKSEPHTQ